MSFLVVDKTKVLKRFDVWDRAEKYAQSKATKLKRGLAVVEMKKNILPENKALTKFFKLTGLDEKTVFLLKGNQTEVMVKRAWYVFIMVKISGVSRIHISNKLGMGYDTINKYINHIEKLVQQPEWITTKWKPLINYIKKNYPEVL